MPILRRHARDTLTAVEMDGGDLLEFTLANGEVARLEVLETGARLLGTTLREIKVEEEGARTQIAFFCRIAVDGRETVLEREIGTQRSFYEPWEIGPLRIWLDAVDAIFDFLVETHGPCRTGVQPHGPRSGMHREVRLAVQDATLRICPQALHLWCPLPGGTVRIEDCYRGEDCWLGAYNGASAHGGLDINHPAGTPLWAPLEIHDHFFFESLEMGHNNNRWRGIHHWPNGSQWILQAHHMTALTVPEHQPLARGEPFALGAGVLNGAAEHSHFVFKIHDLGETILLDPWILFWQALRDGISPASK